MVILKYFIPIFYYFKTMYCLFYKKLRIQQNQNLKIKTENENQKLKIKN